MSGSAKKTDAVLRECTERLLAQAEDARGLDVATLLPRVCRIVEQHLLRDNASASPKVIDKFISALRADDLCLVVACEKGDDAAWRDLIERHTQIVRQSARGATSNSDQAEELVASVWAELHGLRGSVESGKSGGKLAYYSGRGSLGGWLQAVVRQLAVNQHRVSSHFVQVEDDAELDALKRIEPHSLSQIGQSNTNADPEQLLAVKQATDDLHAALTRAIAELTAEDRLLIKLYYADGLRLREAALVLGVHEATTSRRLTSLHGSVRRRVEAILLTERRWTKDEVQRSIAIAVRHLDADLGQLLAAGTRNSGEGLQKI